MYKQKTEHLGQRWVCQIDALIRVYLMIRCGRPPGAYGYA